MSAPGRLNGIIAALEEGRAVFAAFCAPNGASATELGTAAYDAVMIETEHQPWDAGDLHDALHGLMDRRRIHEADSLRPAVTPLVRVPVNGAELGQWHAKQALDLGAYGIVWPHIATVEEARNAVAACRYPSLPEHPLHEPAGLRGDGPTAAARYWGISNAEYYEKADVWPLRPEGELLVGLMIEDQAGIANLDRILSEVPGIGFILIGEGDMSQELGIPRAYEHPLMVACRRRIVETCAAHSVPVGHPHVTVANVEQVLAEGYQLLFTAPVKTYPALELGRRLAREAREPVAVDA